MTLAHDIQLDPRMQLAQRELLAVAEDCREPDWDAYGAAAVTEAAVSNTRRFLEALPSGAPVPGIGAEPDGQITLDWHRDPTHTLSVSVSSDGELHFAALVGRNKTYGTEQFTDQIPGIILNLIHQVGAA
jgi:hypothetical protein